MCWTSTSPTSAALVALGQALDALGAALKPADLPKREAAAKKARKELLALRRIASAARAELDGSRAAQEAAMRQRYGL